MLQGKIKKFITNFYLVFTALIIYNGNILKLIKEHYVKHY